MRCNQPAFISLSTPMKSHVNVFNEQSHNSLITIYAHTSIPRSYGFVSASLSIPNPFSASLYYITHISKHSCVCNSTTPILHIIISRSGILTLSTLYYLSSLNPNPIPHRSNVITFVYPPTGGKGGQVHTF